MLNRPMTVVTLAFALLYASSACAQNSESAVTEPDQASIRKGEQILHEVIKAYHAMPGLKDTISLTQILGEQSQTLTFDVTLGAGADASIKDSSRHILASGDRLVVLSPAENPRRSWSTSLEGNIQDTLMKTPWQYAFWQIAFRYKDEISDVLPTFAFNKVQTVDITGYTKTTIDGQQMHELTFTSPVGTTTAHITDGDYLLKSVHLATPNGFRIAAEMNPQVQSKAPSIEIPAELPRQFSDAATVDLPIEEPIPNVILPRFEGDAISSKELRGSVVVLDFWATWCPPCVQGLPHLERFHQWAKESGMPIKVFAINVWENRGGIPKDEARRRAEQFWGAKKYTIPLLFDAEAQLISQLKFVSIPHTVVIGPDGIIEHVHVGFQRDMYDKLVKETKALVPTELTAR